MEKWSEAQREGLYFVLKAVAAGAVLILIAAVIFLGSPAKACLMPAILETAFATAVLCGLAVTAIMLAIRHWPVDMNKAPMLISRQRLWQRKTSFNVAIGLVGMIATQFVLWGFLPSAA